MGILFNLFLIFYQLVDSKNCIDQDYISQNITKIEKNYLGIAKTLHNFETQGTIRVNFEASTYKKFYILFIGGLEGNLKSALKIIEFANHICSKYQAKDEDYLNFMNYAIFDFIPIGNREFFRIVSENCTEKEGENPIQIESNSCDDYINPDRNFDCSINYKCATKAINNMGSACDKSSVTIRLKQILNDNSYSFIYNIQGPNKDIFIPYDSGKDKLTSSQEYVYKTLLGTSDKYDTRGVARPGTLMDYAMNSSIYSIVYNYDHDRLKPEKIFKEIQSIFGPPAIIILDAEEDSKPSSNSKSKITFETRIRNTFPFEIQVQIELLIRIKDEYLNIILDQESGSLQNKITFKIATLQENLKKKDFDSYDYNHDDNMKEKGIFITTLNATIPASSLLYIHPIYTRTVSGELKYTSSLLLTSTDNRFADIFVKESDLQVSLSNEPKNENKVGIILLMFLVFTLVIATILCTILIKNKQYSILA